MLENWIPPSILPLGAILFNFLFFLVAIPIEAYIFNIRLKFDKKTSIFYAISANLFSGAIGWLIFYLILPVLPIQLKVELMNYVFFNIFKSSNSAALLIFTSFIIFFGTFLVKFFLLRLLVFVLNEDLGKKQEEVQAFQRKEWRAINKLRFQNTNLVTTTLIANSLSYLAITLLLLLRNR